MIVFWALGAVLGAAVLLIVLRPLLFRQSASQISRGQANLAIYRDQSRELDADLAAGKLGPEEHGRSQHDLEARMLEDVDQTSVATGHGDNRGLAAAVGIALTVFAPIIYLLVGTPIAMSPPAEHHAATVEQMESMAERLAARLRDNPDDVEGWKSLGRVFGELGRFREAVDAYARGAVRAPRDPQLLAELADALAMARGTGLQGEPEALVQRALKIDPNNLKALALAGTAAFERKEFAGAAAYWRRMLPHLPVGSEDARTIQASIDDVLRLTGTQDTAATNAGIRGVVELAPNLRGKVDPGDVLFIFARAVEGSQVPLAVRRARASDLPVAFVLDDSMAMAPGMQISSHDRVVVTARISKSGQANARPGDLEGTTDPLPSNASSITVVIDTAIR